METIEFGSITNVSGGGRKIIPQPLNLGYSKIWREAVNNVNLQAGNNNIDGAPVPVGYIWVIENIYIQYDGTTAGVVMAAQIVSNTAGYSLYAVNNPVSTQGYDRQTQFTLEAGEFVRVAISGATAGDDAYLRYIARAIGIIT